MLRAISAPILFEVEKELARTVEDLSDANGNIDPDALQTTPSFIDHRIRNGRRAPYNEQQWNFLRTAGHLAYAAGKKFITRTSGDPEGHHARLYSSFLKADRDSFYTYTFPPGFRPRQEPRDRFLDNLITSNTTIITLLVQAYRHKTHNHPEQCFNQLVFL